MVLVGAFDDPGHGHGRHDSQDIEPHHHQRGGHGIIGKERGHQQGVHGDPCRAGHQRGDEDGGEAVAPVADGARGHDARDGTGEAGEQRDEGTAREAGGAHGAVQQEGGAGEIAGGFKREDEEEEDEDLRQEDDHAPHPTDDTFHHEPAQ